MLLGSLPLKSEGVTPGYFLGLFPEHPTVLRPWGPRGCPPIRTYAIYWKNIGICHRIKGRAAGVHATPRIQQLELQTDAWCLHGTGISQKPGKKLRDINFWFSICSGQAKANLDLLFLCECPVVFAEYSEIWGSEGCVTTSAFCVLRQKFPDFPSL